MRNFFRSQFLDLASNFRRLPTDGSINLLYCHDVNKNDSKNFEFILDSLLMSGFSFIDSDTLVDMLKGVVNFPDSPTIHLSFDDALLGVYKTAFPILRSFSIPATVFVPTGLIGSADKYKNASLCYTLKSPKSNFCSWNQLDAMVSSGFTLGSHTVSHFSLSYLEENGYHIQLQSELLDSYNRILEYGFKYQSLAWPFGECRFINDNVKKLAMDIGYDAIFSGIRGSVSHIDNVNLMSIPRNHFEADWPFAHIKYFIGE